VARPEAELAADALWQAGASAVSEVTLEDGAVRLVAEVDQMSAVPERWGARTVATDPAGDLDAWRAWARPHRAGRHLVVQPTWVEPAATGADDVVISLDPGRAFGSGAHPSTLLALAVIEDLVTPATRVLDVGCGSGVLAVAAALLGADRVVAVDVDPAAVEATRQNALLNGVAHRVEVSTTPLGELTDRFDLVLANIGVRVLTDLAAGIEACVASDGALLLSGLLDDQVDGTLAAYARVREAERRSLDGWSIVRLVR